MAKSRHYYSGGGHFERVLRFFNILEPTPGKLVLSLSKMSMYGMFVVVVYVLQYQSDNLPALIGAALGQTGTLVNYGYRRFEQRQQQGTLPSYGEEPNE